MLSIYFEIRLCPALIYPILYKLEVFQILLCPIRLHFRTDFDFILRMRMTQHLCGHIQSSLCLVTPWHHRLIDDALFLEGG